MIWSESVSILDINLAPVWVTLSNCTFALLQFKYSMITGIFSARQSAHSNINDSMHASSTAPWTCWRIAFQKKYSTCNLLLSLWTPFSFRAWINVNLEGMTNVGGKICATKGNESGNWTFSSTIKTNTKNHDYFCLCRFILSLN